MHGSSMPDIIDTGALLDALTYHIALMMPEMREAMATREETPNWRIIT